MTKPFLLVQLSDTHVGAPAALGDSRADLEAAVEAIQRLPDPADAVVVTGDLVQAATDDEYQALREALGRLGVPVYPVAGNQDHRSTLRRHFAVPEAPDERVEYAVDLGPLRLVVLDTMIPGELRGRLSIDQLGWLEAQLAAAPEQPTVLAMHHPPVDTLVPAWDALGLPATDRAALGDILRRSPQVRRILAGHYHRAILANVEGALVVTVPSTLTQGQLPLDFGGTAISFVPDSAAFAVHALQNGQMVTHLQQIRVAPS